MKGATVPPGEDAGLYGVLVQGWVPESKIFEHITVTSGRSLRKDDSKSVMLSPI